MSQDLVNISLSAGSHELIRRLNKINYSLGSLVETIGENAIKGTTELALKAYKSKIPIDTLTLRGKGLNDGFLRVEINEFSGAVIIEEGTHTNSRGKQQSSNKLADILQSGIGEGGRTLNRTQNPAAIDNYGSESRRSPTADWEGKAFRAFISPAKLGSYLKNTDFTKNVK